MPSNDIAVQILELLAEISPYNSTLTNASIIKLITADLPVHGLARSAI